MKSRSATIWVILLFVATPWPCEPVFGGYLYGTDDTDSRLLRIDPTNGNYTQVSGSIPLIDGLAYNSSDGYLYGTDATDSRLLRIDPTNGNYNQVSGSIPLIDGLAYVPEPATLLLLGLSVAMLGRRRA